MASPGLSISRLVSTSVSLTATPAQPENIDTLLYLGSSGAIDVVQRMRQYQGVDGVASDFGTSAPEYLAAVLWFEQNPQPGSLFIGEWAKTATSGKLLGGPKPSLTYAAFTGITTGGIDFTVDGTAHNLTGLNFSAVTNLNGVATIITTGLAGAATVVWNANYERFEVTSATSGTSSTVAFATAGAGTDISSLTGLTQATSGAYVANGIAAETAVSAVNTFDTQFSDQWYGLSIDTTTDSDHVAVANYIEAAQVKHYYGVSTQEAGVLVSTDTSNIAYQLQQLKLDRSSVFYSSTTPYSVMSYLARILTTDWGANNSTINLMYKQAPGIVPENLNATQIAALEGFNCNVFVSYNNDTAIIERGTSASGQFTDTIIGTDWLAVTIQTEVYNLLYTSPTKIPQTDGGMHLIGTTIENVLQAAVNNGLLAPGVWNSQGFGIIKQGDYLPKGFYVYWPPVATQSETTRAARISVPFQVAAKLAGAVNTVDVSVFVNP